jgi:hypothetical protein
MFTDTQYVDNKIARLCDDIAFFEFSAIAHGAGTPESSYYNDRARILRIELANFLAIFC